MKSEIPAEVLDVMNAVHYRPAVSLFMPFEPKMNSSVLLKDQLKFATDKIAREIREGYTGELGELVIGKLRAIIKNLNFNTHKKSIAIYVSPLFEKVLYLDIPLEEKIIIDESFEIRDLVFAKKEIHKYLVLVLSANTSKLYIGNTVDFIKIKSNTHFAVENDETEKVANFSDPAHYKEVLLKKFLHRIDQELSHLLQFYRMPLFVMGVEKVLGYFKAISKNDKQVVGYVHGNYEEATETELRKTLVPYVNDWKRVKAEDLRHQLERSADEKKLVTGINDVLKQASHQKGRLLVVEKNFMHPGTEEDSTYTPEYSKFSYIRDVVDDVIEKVLESGGDVEFVDEDALKGYNHIALILFY